MYRYLLLSVVITLASAASAWAGDPLWQGPGWYLTYMGVGLVSGPFANQGLCAADLANRASDPGLDCEYLNQEP